MRGIVGVEILIAMIVISIVGIIGIKYASRFLNRGSYDFRSPTVDGILCGNVLTLVVDEPGRIYVYARDAYTGTLYTCTVLNVDRRVVVNVDDACSGFFLIPDLDEGIYVEYVTGGNSYYAHFVSSCS